MTRIGCLTAYPNAADLILFLALWIAIAAAAAPAHAGVAYSQPSAASGVFYQSSWYGFNEQGSDADQYVWDNFTLAADAAITEIDWRGAFDPAKFGYGGAVQDFTIAIYGTVAGIQPDVTHPPLVQYQAGGNAGQTLAGTFGGTAMYDYAFVLPAPFQATAGTKYWLQIFAWQNGYPPDWAWGAGTGGDSSHFMQFVNYAGGNAYASVGGDAAFTLVTSAGPTATAAVATATATASATPSATGTATITVATTPTASSAPTQSATPPLCVGDCGGDKHVTVDEILVLVSLALGNGGSCPSGIAAGVTVDVSLIIQAVNNALNACPV